MTFPNRLRPPRKATPSQILFGMRIVARVLWQVGWRSDYRQVFWRHSGPLLGRGRIEEVIHIGLVSHHLIRFSREAVQGNAEACFYADPNEVRPAAV